MRALFLGVTLFIVAFICHFVLWKFRIPKRQIRALLVIYFGFFLFCLPWISVFSSFIPFLKDYGPFSFLEYCRICLLFVSITFVYIELYSTLETDSPSLLMISHIAEGHEGGVPREDLEHAMAFLVSGHLIRDRLSYIVRDKMGYVEQGKYRLSKKGRCLVKALILYKKLLGLDAKLG